MTNARFGGPDIPHGAGSAVVMDQPKADPRQASSLIKVGLFGKYGASNIGNDASLEALLTYLQTCTPPVLIDALCTGPEAVKARFNIDARALQWSHLGKPPESRAGAMVRKSIGLVVDAFRIAAWTRRHDTVLIPGTGVLEASLPIIPRSFPYYMLLLCAAGRLFGTKVALVDVGAGAVNQRGTRWAYDWVVRLSTYRSYRDEASRASLSRRGLDVSSDQVYPDLAFALPAPEPARGDPQVVGIGVMDYHGNNDKRRHGKHLRESYLTEMKRFVRWLVDNGRDVRLFVGDANGSDDVVVREILADIRAHQPHLDPTRVIAEPVASFAELMRAISNVGSVVAVRYHNVLCALKLSKPTISISYSGKHDALMTAMGLAEFCHPVATLDSPRLVRQFEELQRRSEELRQTLTESNAKKSRLVEDQFAALSAELFHACSHPPNGTTAQPTATTNPRATNTYDKAFWKSENLKFSEPWYRLEKAARLITSLAGDRHCTLLDVGCGPATLMRLLPPNIDYYGIDIAIQSPAPNLLEADVLKASIRFQDKHFDIVVAEGLFEYLGDFQSQKFSEIVQLLNPNGHFVVSYTNFDHRKAHISELFSNVQSSAEFRTSLSRYFKIDRIVTESHNWKHAQPNRPWLKALNLRLNTSIPFVSRKLAVEHFFVCSPLGDADARS